VSEWSLPDPAARVKALRDPEDEPPTAANANGPVGGTQSTSGWLLVVGGGLAVLGSILPWSVVTSSRRVLSADGLTGDGRITILLGLAVVVVGVLALVGRPPRPACIGALVAAAVVVVIAGYNAFDLDALGTASDQMASLEMGHGLLITAIGGTVAVVGGVRLLAASTAEPGAA
jgi:hypothetical protein